MKPDYDECIDNLRDFRDDLEQLRDHISIIARIESEPHFKNIYVDLISQLRKIETNARDYIENVKWVKKKEM